MNLFVEDFAQKISSARSVEDLRQDFLSYMENVGMDQFTYLVVRHNFHHNLANYYVTNFSKEWENHYLSRDYFQDDPLVSQYKRNLSPFTWGWGKSPDVTARTNKMFSEAADFNLDRGIGIPIPGPGGSFSVLTLCSNEHDLKEIEKIKESKGKDLMIAALMFHSGVISLNLQDAMHQQHELTNKEADCLKLICAGKSYSEIAHLYNVTESAIKKRALNIYAKIGVSTRHEAILKTFKYKIVEV